MLGAGPAYSDVIGDAAEKLSIAAYPFLKEVDWTSQLALQKPGSASFKDYLKACQATIDMGAAMDTNLLKAGVNAHHRAIAYSDSSGLTTFGAFKDVNAAIGRMVASVPESKVMAVYDAWSKVVSPDVPSYLKASVNADDAEKAYRAFLEFKDVVKANPIRAAKDAAYAPQKAIGIQNTVAKVTSTDIDAAAGNLASAAYPFLKSIDWGSDLSLTPVASNKALIAATDKALLMGAAMNGAALKEAALAHSKAISSIDAKGVTTQADFAAINAGLGKAIASVPTQKVMDVYNAFGRVVPAEIPQYLFSKTDGESALKAYAALMDFKDVVKAAQR